MKTKKKIVISTILIMVIAFLIAIIIYLNTYYKADNTIQQYLKSSDTVSVSQIDNGYFFDGYGKDSAIIFYPGAKVETIAYAKLMYKIAESGKDCFLLEMPFHIAFFGSNLASKIIENYDYENWYLAGHSMGGVVASLYTVNNPDKVYGLILLASYPTKKIPDNIEFVSIYGDKDGVLNLDNYKDSKQYWPENAQELVINGGNHANFGNYGKQKGDNKATISSDKQQEEVINIINDKSR